MAGLARRSRSAPHCDIRRLVWSITGLRHKTGAAFTLTRFVRWRDPLLNSSPHTARRLNRASILLEITLIVIWAIWVGRNYLNFDLHLWPVGREYGFSIQSYFTWVDLWKCGACFLWNGSLNGGAPAFVELQGAPLHPLVALSTIGLGPINASKVVLIGSLIMAGLAQWWLARVLNLSWLPRLWCAGLAIVGGHLAGRMETGVVGLVLSMAACSLVLPPLLKLTLTGQRRATLQLAVMLALAILSGQGYLQIGLAVCYGLPLLIFWVKNPQRPARLWREYALAAALALLLAAIFLVPLLHFWPNFEKDTDVTFNTSQPLEYIPLNFVIHDLAFYQTTDLQKANIPYLYINYIGWIPILLAALSIGLIGRANRLSGYFWLAIGLALFIGSAVPLRWLFNYMPVLAASIRFPAFVVGLAVPPLLALAAWGLDRLTQLKWPGITIRSRRLDIRWLVLAPLLIWSLQSAYEFSATWLTVQPAPIVSANAIAALRTPNTEWINAEYGSHYLLPMLLSAGYKLSPSFSPWHWKARKTPEQYLDAGFKAILPSTPGYVGSFDGLYVQQHPLNEYAYVNTGSPHPTCRAQAHGGDIDVECTTDTAGALIVKENNWTGWQATRDGQLVELNQDSLWLSVAAPAGSHHFEFRYRPWDVPVGLALTLTGVGLLIWLWLRTVSPQSAARQIDHAQNHPD